MSAISEYMHTRSVVLTRRQCLHHLAECRLGRVVAVLRGRAIIRPVSYVYDASGNVIVFRSGAGIKLDALRRVGEVTFEIDAADPVTATGWSVIVRGRLEPLTRHHEIERARQLQLESLFPATQPHLFQIHVVAVSGRAIVAD